MKIFQLTIGGFTWGISYDSQIESKSTKPKLKELIDSHVQAQTNGAGSRDSTKSVSRIAASRSVSKRGRSNVGRSKSTPAREFEADED